MRSGMGQQKKLLLWKQAALKPVASEGLVAVDVGYQVSEATHDCGMLGVRCMSQPCMQQVSFKPKRHRALFS